jgi:hypothetical protein
MSLLSRILQHHTPANCVSSDKDRQSINLKCRWVVTGDAPLICLAKHLKASRDIGTTADGKKDFLNLDIQITSFDSYATAYRCQSRGMSQVQWEFPVEYLLNLAIDRWIPDTGDSILISDSHDLDAQAM